MSAHVDRIRLGPLENPVRGLLHGGAGFASIWLAALLWATPSGDLRWRLMLAGFALSQAALFTVSSLYHSVPWDPVWKRRMQRFDHSMIYLCIAGTSTPILWMGLDGPLRAALTAGTWMVAALGIAQKALLPDFPERVSIPVQIFQTTLALPALVALGRSHPTGPGQLLWLGAALFTVGTLVFVTERPRLWPRVFSFHELFHLFVVAGWGLQHAALQQALRVAMP